MAQYDFSHKKLEVINYRFMTGVKSFCSLLQLYRLLSFDFH